MEILQLHLDPKSATRRSCGPNTKWFIQHRRNLINTSVTRCLNKRNGLVAPLIQKELPISLSKSAEAPGLAVKYQAGVFRSTSVTKERLGLPKGKSKVLMTARLITELKSWSFNTKKEVASTQLFTYIYTKTRWWWKPLAHLLSSSPLTMPPQCSDLWQYAVSGDTYYHPDQNLLKQRL